MASSSNDTLPLLADVFYIGAPLLVAVLGVVAYRASIGSRRVWWSLASIGAYLVGVYLTGAFQDPLTYVAVTRAFRAGDLSINDWHALSVLAIEQTAARVVVGTLAALALIAIAYSYSRRRRPG